MSETPVPAPAKVVFLDIDGPMIPATMFLVDRMASYHRRFPPTTVAVINRLCEETGAKIVFNTTHNRPFDGVPDIGAALVEQGLDAEHIHSDGHTRYPDIPRDLAVKEWLKRHPEALDWIALDDTKFTDAENLIWVDPEAGLHLGHLNQGIRALGGKPVLVLM